MTAYFPLEGHSNMIETLQWLTNYAIAGQIYELASNSVIQINYFQREKLKRACREKKKRTLSGFFFMQCGLEREKVVGEV